MGKRCLTCRRPIYVARPPAITKPNPLKHCPRALTAPGDLEGAQVTTVTCLAIGITVRDAALSAALTRTRQLQDLIDDVLSESDDVEEPV